MGKETKGLLKICVVLTFTGVFLSACTKAPVTSDINKVEITPIISTPTPVAVETWQVEADSMATQVNIDNFTTHQTMDGFGAAYTWYNDWMSNNPNDAGAYDLSFSEAKLSIIRFRNTYKYTSVFAPKAELEIYQEAQKRAKERGEKITVLLSSWSPAAYLKDNNSIGNGGTLKKDENGQFIYEEYADYWLELIQAYEAYGIPIDYITLQNELDFETDYDSCNFVPVETDTRAAYSKAHIAVYKALQTMEHPPKILGPETMTVDATQIKLYMKDVIEQAPESLYGIAHHLYAGADENNPDSFTMHMFSLKKLYPEYAKWQTEYYRGNAFTTAWIIQNSLVYEDLNAYLYWDGAWEAPVSGFMNFENPYAQAGWTTEKGYYPGEKFYSLRHFSEFIRPGYKRIDVAPTGDRKLLVSAYISEAQDKIAAVIINTSDADMNIQLHFSSYHVLDSNLYVSDCKEGYTLEDLYVNSGKLSENHTLTIPAKGIVTLDLSGEPGANVTTPTE